MQIPHYHARMIFLVTLSGSEDATSITVDQTIPFIPTAPYLDECAKSIRTNFIASNIPVEEVKFDHYETFEEITQNPGQNMSADRAKQIAFCALQLMRQKAEENHKDPNDFDDWLFSELDIEIQELIEIYKPYPNVLVYGGSCFETNQSPKNFDTKYFAQ